MEAIEAVFAHEAVHVKKRDVMIGQIIRILALLVIVLFIYLLVIPFSYTKK
ncbi:M48 family metalloprotease [Aeribacillus sp. FSL M8-0254]|uniref:M48 family metalloprotease n=1 Tax=Aeribacillus sp. FSL M8-0254 TaxID=2954577 RepID=UPI004046BE76